MGQFRYIVSGGKAECHVFFESLTHCYHKDIEFECGDEGDYCLWVSGQRKHRPDLWEIQSASRKHSLDVKGSYENEDREPGEAAGETFRYKNGKYVDGAFSDDEATYLDPEQYGWE